MLDVKIMRHGMKYPVNEVSSLVRYPIESDRKSSLPSQKKFCSVLVARACRCTRSGVSATIIVDHEDVPASVFTVAKMEVIEVQYHIS